MEFAKYYDVSDIVDIMIKNEEIDCYRRRRKVRRCFMFA